MISFFSMSFAVTVTTAASAAETRKQAIKRSSTVPTDHFAAAISSIFSLHNILIFVNGFRCWKYL